MSLITGGLIFASTIDSAMFEWLAQAFYPALFSVFVIASLGIPIPEDLPLMIAGFILHHNPDEYSWPVTLLVAFCGIMSGDLILYTLGKRWGPDVFSHRSVSWLITPDRMAAMTVKFHRYGVWMVFVGRMLVGVRAVMCLTAGVTKFPYWKFFLADASGALLSIPLFMGLGYFFADQFDSLWRYVSDAKWIALGAAALVTVGITWWEWRKLRAARLAASNTATPATPVPAPAAPRAGAAEARPGFVADSQTHTGTHRAQTGVPRPPRAVTASR